MSRTVVCDGYSMENMKRRKSLTFNFLAEFSMRFLCPILKNRKALEEPKRKKSALKAACGVGSV